MFLAPLLERLRARAPRLRLAVHPLDSARLTEQLASGDIDFALTVPERAAPDLHARELFPERYVCAVRQDHPRIKRTLSLDTFCAMDHVLVSPTGGGFQGVADLALRAHGKLRNVALSVPSFLIVPRMLQAGDLVALVPERLLADQSDRVRVFEPPIEIPGFTIIAVWHTRTHKSPAHVWLRKQMAAVAEHLRR